MPYLIENMLPTRSPSNQARPDASSEAAESSHNRHRTLPSLQLLLGSSSEDSPYFTAPSNQHKWSYPQTQTVQPPSASGDARRVYSHDPPMPASNNLPSVSSREAPPYLSPSSAQSESSFHPPMLLPHQTTPYGFPPPIRHDSARSPPDMPHSANGSPYMTTVQSTPTRRIVDRREIPGEGVCFIYDDGSHCKAEVAGEPVNPDWGVTKAGRPRKRLAVACLPCRDKKIKCEPGLSKCVQCVKSQRECKKPHASSVTPESDVSTRPEWPTPGKRRRPSSETTPSRPHSIEDGYLPSVEQPGHRMKPDSLEDIRYGPLNGESAAKRPRPMAREPSRPETHGFLGNWDHMSPAPKQTPISATMNPAAFEWEVDPYEANPSLTSDLLSLYFAHRDYGTYKLLPQKPFTQWVVGGKPKSPDDRMVLYVLLAMGSLFSKRPDRKSLGKKFASIARGAAEKTHSKFTLQLIHVRMHLGLYMFARGNHQESYDFSGAAMRAICALRFNTNDGLEEDTFDKREYDYGFDRNLLIECRRRTFWLCYMMDRFSVYSTGYVSSIHDEDVFQRLPGRESDYDTTPGLTGPYFDNGIISKCDLERTAVPDRGSTANLVVLASIWGRITMNASRSVHRSPPDYLNHYETFYDDIEQRVEDWESLICPNIRYGSTATSNALSRGYFGIYLVLHAVRNLIGMKLNRLGRHELLPTNIVKRNLQRARDHAKQFLSLVSELNKVDHDHRSNDIENALSQPFLAYAILSACDIVSSGGHVESLSATIKTLTHARYALAEIGRYWRTASKYQAMISQRLVELNSVALSARDEPRWRMRAPIEAAIFTHGDGDDLVYTTSSDCFYEALINPTATDFTMA